MCKRASKQKPHWKARVNDIQVKQLNYRRKTLACVLLKSVEVLWKLILWIHEIFFLTWLLYSTLKEIYKRSLYSVKRRVRERERETSTSTSTSTLLVPVACCTTTTIDRHEKKKPSLWKKKYKLFYTHMRVSVVFIFF